jgi:hypothetical protein
MKLLPDTSPEHIDKKLRAERLRRIFWQGANPLGGPRTDVCPIVAEYMEVETINNLKSEIEICYSTKGTGSNMILRDLQESWRAEVIIPILHLWHLSPSKSENYLGR